MGQTGSSSPKINKNDKVILKLKIQRDSLLKYNGRLGILINNDLDNAKSQLLQGNKPQSIRYLRMKKRHEEILNKTLNQIDSLEQMVLNIEDKLLEKQFISKLAEGNEILRVLNRECSVDKVDQVVEEAMGNIETTNEISDALANGVVADEDIEEELRLLQQDISKEIQGKETEDSVAQQLPSIEVSKPVFPAVSNKQLRNPQDNAKKTEKPTEAILST